MPGSRAIENDFIAQITQIIEKNISNEQFGVTELAREVSMSRSNLLRKVKKLTNLSVSQFIREVRLKHANELLRESSYTVSEVAYKVGFNSPSYFIKCFGDYFGYPPGEAGKKEIVKDNIPEEFETNSKVEEVQQRFDKGTRIDFTWSFVLVVAIILWFAFFATDFFKKVGHVVFGTQPPREKSIAVLPFINDSNDSTNVYIINGLMEATLNNLQKIEDLRVISRTTVEKFRKSDKTTPEISKELNATYVIEGSGQKIGDQILLNIQLIEAKTDDHLWSKQYKEDTQDIFDLQAEVAKNIAEEIKVIITPEEEQRIDKAPTNDLVAYDYFLKGLDLLQQPTRENLTESIPYFRKAIERDKKFARAYAGIAIAYYYLEEGKAERQYSDSINTYADLSLFYDSQLPQSLIAKALFYMAHKEYEMAVPYFEKALEYNPNYDLVYIFLVDLYVNYLPDTEKYLEYALKGLRLDLVAAYDSATASYSYLHISNAFIQSGFIGEAEKYIDKSLDHLPGNIYSQYLKAYILYAKNQDLNQLKESLLSTFEKDTTRLDVMQEVGKVYYYLRDYETSFLYYKKFAEIREMYKLEIYRSENGKIGVVFDKTGFKEDSEKYLEAYRLFAENDPSVYKHFSYTFYYSYIGETEKALEHLELFLEEENYHYWTVLFTPIDPLVDNIKDLPEFKEIFDQIESKFRKYHERIRTSLEEKDLL